MGKTETDWFDMSKNSGSFKKRMKLAVFNFK